MATAVQKITLSSSRDIPFNKLVLSQSNVRRVRAGVSVEELAESIARRGLIQSLHVRPVLDDDGVETGMFEVPAGGRRFRALELLVKQKRLAKIAPVPCVVSEATGDVLIDEVSLAENIERAPLHPLDQFRAFQTMREKGMTEEAIAAAFFVDAKVVKQRLRLASVSPTLLETYAEDGMTLEQLMAFTVSSDHARQEQVWEVIKDGWQKEPYTIRRLLTETTVRAADKRAVFVGIDAYEEAGGCVLRDLFQQDDGGWLQDPVLLDRLVGEKLKAEAETIAAEGWKWIEVAMTFPYGHDHGLRPLVGTTVDLTEDERAVREALRDEYDRLEAEYAEADELPDEVDTRLGEIEQALEVFERRPMTFDPDQIGKAGVFVSIDADGTLLVERGHVRPDDEAPAEPEAEVVDPETGEVLQRAEPQASHQRAVIMLGGQSPEPEEEDETDAIKPLPDRLVSELTAHRTLALRDATTLRRRSIRAVPLLDHVAQRAITRPSLRGHPGENRNRRIDIVHDQDIPLSVVLTMQPPDILRQGPLPGDRHRQEQSVEASIIKAFADIAACREDQALMIIGDIQGSAGGLAIGRRHAAAQDHEISHEWQEPLLKIIEVVFPLRQNDGRTLGLKRFQHIIEDQIIPGTVLRQRRIDRRHRRPFGRG
ncbi:ParB/RepB/Spo0J family partition protein [Devosia faecipullorum]|nr:ParB/RepB/Spo0J family partition protein [Devosia faecipullorum]